MTINEYQKLAMTTLNPALDKKDVLINGVMGLCGEAGEAIDLVKKHLAQGHPLDRQKLIGELEGLLADKRKDMSIPVLAKAADIPDTVEARRQAELADRICALYSMSLLRERPMSDMMRRSPIII